MKTLQGIAVEAVASALSNAAVYALINDLPGRIKSDLLERILLDGEEASEVPLRQLGVDFFENVHNLRLPQSPLVNDALLARIATSGCRIRRLTIVVPLTDENRRDCPVTVAGLAALFGHQNQLEDLRLVWCAGFRAGVLCKIKSDLLQKVSLHGDGVCRCILERHPVLRLSKAADNPYQREVSVLALNNPTISHLTLDSILLDYNDCNTLLTALADSLQRLDIKVVRCYQFCEKQHCFFGRNFVPFLRLVDARCHRLRYLSCYSHIEDPQTDLLAMVQCPLVKLSLEGHYFSTPLILPPTLEKLKLSVCGDESTEFFDNLRQLPHLRRLYITDNGDTYSKRSRKSLLSFSDKLHGLSITLFDVAHDSKFIYRLATNYSNLTTLDITDCLMRKEFGGGRLIDDLLSRPDGTDLMPLFSSPQKAAQLKHLRLSLATISRHVLETIADNCVGLRTLDLANCPSLTDELLERIAFNSGQTLKVVDIARCSEITNQGIVGVALYCPNLEEIMMFQCAVSDEALYALGSNCLHLRVCGIHPGAASREAIDYVKRSTDGRLFV